MRSLFTTLLLTFLVAIAVQAKDNKGITHFSLSSDRFTLVENGKSLPILVDENDNSAVQIALKSLAADFGRVTGTDAQIVNTPTSGKSIIVGSLDSKFIKQLIKSKKIDKLQLQGKVEKYIMTTVSNPIEGIDEALVIAGSDRRGAVYGIYELSEQIGVSPWYDWMDVPVAQNSNISIERGTYTAGEPAVRYRGIFLNDEAPCLTSWVKNTYGTDYGDHRFYARVFELVLRLRGNFMWPAMWGWAFYADDIENSKTADDMGIIMGTSHHEPMARNHQEWARHRKEYGAWDFESNKEVITRFFTEGIERAKNNEDLITIGMRGDGDTALGGKEGHDDEYVSDDAKIIALLEKICKEQRDIIKRVTGQKPEKRPQVWALYKEVQKYYDLGLKVPEDVIILLSDDNWGHVRRVPTEKELQHKGGYGMYYHVDYVGAPRNSKWLNVTPIQNMWEQLQLTYDHQIDKIWILNVGDLKPMEFPISMFLDMAWNPKAYTNENLMEHVYDFCAQQFGASQAKEATRILNLLCKYNGRSTAEMLDHGTYNLQNGEWEKVVNQYTKLEAEALRQYMSLADNQKDAYKQLILFPLQAMGNIYEMYYAQAQNLYYASLNMPEANTWADRVEECFQRDSLLCADYNKNMANGKWDGMMIQKHIGYFSWNDNFPKDTCPKVIRVANPNSSDIVFLPKNGVVAIEAQHFTSSADATSGAKWTVIPDMGRTLSGVALMPYSKETAGAKLEYKLRISNAPEQLPIHFLLNSTLPFKRATGHRFLISINGGEKTEVNFNKNLNENPENVYSIYYPTVARRVVAAKANVKVPANSNGVLTLTIEPLDPGMVMEKIVVDLGGFENSMLYGEESPIQVLM
ncbi:MAG: glycosyl hydrolase 115 family protein [Bacteroidia bacterium]|nr:glycosyl hydrolase 115 family protein [Bacteroidia bacterium]